MASCKCHESKLNERKQSNNEKHNKNDNVEDVEKSWNPFCKCSSCKCSGIKKTTMGD